MGRAGDRRRGLGDRRIVVPDVGISGEIGQPHAGADTDAVLVYGNRSQVVDGGQGAPNHAVRLQLKGCRSMR